jgi:hypothetical protein
MMDNEDENRIRASYGALRTTGPNQGEVIRISSA